MAHSSISKRADNPLDHKSRQRLSTGFLNNDSTRAAIIQGMTLGLVLFSLWFVFANANTNLDQLGMSFGFDFLEVTAGFNISWSLIEYDPSMSYWRVFLVGIFNTLVLSFAVIVFGTVIGSLVGIMRLSQNPLVAYLARGYVEVVRNVPLLIQIIFWFTVVFSSLPSPRQSYSLFDLVILNNRGLYVPSANLSVSSGWALLLALVAVIGGLLIYRWSARVKKETGKHPYAFYGAVVVWALLIVAAYRFLSIWIEWSIPSLKGFNYSGGTFLPASFGAAFVAMTVYRSAAIAETVRAGMQSIDRGQQEAAFTIGFSSFQTLRLVLIPQAVRAIIPPMTNSWLAATKDSSLAVAIGFPELVSVFMQTSINQTGRAIEIISMVMGFYILISLLMSYLLNQYNERSQYKVR